MLTSIDNMPESSRVWVYQANRDLTAPEQEQIQTAANQFFGQWAAHGSDLKSSYQILHDRFLVIMVDESMNVASGCSIDASVHFVQKIQQSLGVDFFDRAQVAFLEDNKVITETLTSIKPKVSEGVIDRSTLTFNNLVKSKGEMDEKWLVPAGETWLSRYF